MEADIRYSIYGLYEPDSNDLRYIGITNGWSNRDLIMRLSHHLSASIGGLHKGNVDLTDWISSLIDDGKIPYIKQLMQCDDKITAIQEEAKMIFKYHKVCKLLNMMHNPNTPQQFRKSHDSSKPFRKLNENEVIEIIRLWNSGKTQIEICRIFSVTQTCISAIICRKNWRHLKIEINETGSRFKKPHGRKELYKKVAQIDPLTMKTVKIFRNSGDAADEMGCTIYALIPCLRGKRHSGRGYIWKYIE
jgi:hypothetical protein